MKGHIKLVGKKWGFRLDVGRDENGKRIQKWFGGYRTKKEAEKACAEKITEIERGTYTEPIYTTVGDYLRDWLKTQSVSLSPCTYNGYKVNIEKHIIPHLGKIPLQKLQPMQIQKFYIDIFNTGVENSKDKLSATSIRYIHATLRKALNDAMKMGMVYRNVAEGVAVPKQKQYESKFLTQEQMNAMLEALKDTDIYLPTLLAVGLGLRRGEVLGLQWETVDFEKSLISIKRAYIPTPQGNVFSDVKTEKSRRTLAVPSNIMQYLRLVKEQQDEIKSFLGAGYSDNDLVCCNKDGSPLSPSTWNHKFKKLMKENGMPDIRIHDLRHTNASLMLKRGVTMKVASDRLGHATIGITMDLYSHIDEEQQRDAAQRINEAISIKET